MNKLGEVFDIVEVVHGDNTSTIVIPEMPEPDEDIDFDFVRANHYKLATQASDAMDIAMRIAKESEQPRAIETLGALLKTASEVNRQLLLLNKDKADVKQAKTGKGPAVVAPQPGIGVQNNVVFTGNSSELNKLLKEMKDTNNGTNI